MSAALQSEPRLTSPPHEGFDGSSSGFRTCYYFVLFIFPFPFKHLQVACFQKRSSLCNLLSGEHTFHLGSHAARVLIRNTCRSCIICSITDKEGFRFWHVNMFPAYSGGQEAEHSHSSSLLHRPHSKGSSAGTSHTEKDREQGKAALLFPDHLSQSQSSRFGSVASSFSGRFRFRRT